MGKFDNKKIIPRYSFIAVLMFIVGMAVIGRVIYIMTVKRDYWTEVAKQRRYDNKTALPTRGNILSDNGELMASTLPEYRLTVDFKVSGEVDTALWREKMDSICEGLHEIFPEKTAEEFKAHLKEGLEKEKRYWLIWPRRVNYDTYKRVEKLPIFNMGRYIGGFRAEENSARKRPFGTLAARTIGDMYGEKDSARFGLEQSYDSILRGQKGKYHTRRVMNRWLNFTDNPVTDGDDILTTINVQMQDIAEKAVMDELYEINGDIGVAIVMEVATGDVKAIVNLQKCSDGMYREILNHALSDMHEPGSVFKTASVMVALDDGVVDTSFVIHTGNGQKEMYGQNMNDHNRASGGYGSISLGRAIQVSSNIGVSQVIKDNYAEEPEKFLAGLDRIGITENLHLPDKEYVPPKFKRPKRTSNGKLDYNKWPATTLPWMSIGYETMIPPISTITFYNAIANDGKMVKPRFIKQRLREGEVVEEYPVEVLRQQICKPQTLSKIRTLLEQVVTCGTGKKAKCESFTVAGKTGTALISQGKSGYKSGVAHYLVSFAGYFPADKPRYSCIVCLQKTGLPASGGTMSGWVFHNIAEGIMAHSLNVAASSAVDSEMALRPLLQRGNLSATSLVLGRLGFSSTLRGMAEEKKGQPLWGSVGYAGNSYLLNAEQSKRDVMPDVKGMGARDAVYMLENMGLKVTLLGRGKVMQQSLAVGSPVKRGSHCELRLGF